MPERFSVYQFFPDGSYEKALSSVGADEAVRCAIGLTRSIGGKIGTTKRVIVTDGEDLITLEWEFGKGITFPPECVSKI